MLFIPPSPKCPSRGGWGSRLRREGSPTGVSSYSSPPHPCSSPPQFIKYCPQRRGLLSRTGGLLQPIGCQAGTKSKQGPTEGKDGQGRQLPHTKCSLKGGRALPCPPSPQAAPAPRHRGSQRHRTSPSSMLKLLRRLLALEASGDMVEKRGSEARGSRESSRSIKSRSFLDRLGNGEPCSVPRGSW